MAVSLCYTFYIGRGVVWTSMCKIVETNLNVGIVFEKLTSHCLSVVFLLLIDAE